MTWNVHPDYVVKDVSGRKKPRILPRYRGLVDTFDRGSLGYIHYTEKLAEMSKKQQREWESELIHSLVASRAVLSPLEQEMAQELGLISEFRPESVRYHRLPKDGSAPKSRDTAYIVLVDGEPWKGRWYGDYDQMKKVFKALLLDSEVGTRVQVQCGVGGQIYDAHYSDAGLGLCQARAPRKKRRKVAKKRVKKKPSKRKAGKKKKTKKFPALRDSSRRRIAKKVKKRKRK